jgi:hypothetical protein
MTTINLPSGATVTLRDPKTIKSGERDKALRGLNLTDDNQLDTIFDLTWRVASVLIESWSFDLIPPSIKPESLDELTLEDADALRGEIVPFIEQLMPKFDRTEKAAADPKAPTDN